jgi:hypothetical protein
MHTDMGYEWLPRPMHLWIRVTKDHILLLCPRYHMAHIKLYKALQLTLDDVAVPPAPIIRKLLYPKPPKRTH